MNVLLKMRGRYEREVVIPVVIRTPLIDALREAGAAEDEAARPETLAALWQRIRRVHRTVEDLTDLLRRQPIEDAVRAARHLLIEGAPGAGKTTVLKHVAMALVEALRGHPARALAMGFTAPFPLPIFVYLRRFAVWLGKQPEERRQSGGAELLIDYLRDIVGPMSGGGAWLGPALAEGGVAVLLDGLDEIADAYLRDRTADIVRDIVREHPACRFLLTSRPAGLSAVAKRLLTEVGDLAHTTVQSLDDTQVERFVHTWYRALLTNEDEASQKAVDLLARIRRSPARRGGDLAALARTPIILTAIAIVHQSYGRLPERRADLYEHCVQSLAHLWQQAKEVEDGLDRSGDLTQDQKIGLLQEIALRIQEAGESAQAIESGLLEALVAARLSSETGRRREPSECRAIIDTMAERSGLLVPDRDGAYRFRHLQFQEFLAARCICVVGEDRVNLLAQHITNPSWREVVVLAPAFKAVSDKVQTREILNGLIERVTAMSDAQERVGALATIARALLDLREYDVSGLDNIAARVATVAVCLLEDPAQPGTTDDRIAIGTALALCPGGDPRLGKERRWVEVPGGAFWRGAATDDPMRDDEIPGGWIHVSRFYIQRWPVTSGEFARFVAEGGYTNRQWWSRKGWAWRVEGEVQSPEAWDQQQDHPSNVPVGGISWWEAEAYCRWLDAHVERPANGLVVRLPTEAEWEKAARGGKLLSDGQKNPEPKRPWPWGSTEPKDERGSIVFPPVGCFPVEHGPYGVWDQVMNFWEWCLDWYHPDAYSLLMGPDACWLDARSAPEVETLEPDEDAMRARSRVQRGGNPSGQVSARDWYPPWKRARLVGFRCVLAAPRTT